MSVDTYLCPGCDKEVRVGSRYCPHCNPPSKRRKRQRLRSVAIALGLGFLVILFYAATIVRMGGHGGGQSGEFSPPSQSGQSTGGAPANGGAP